jgi:hypothetical protein
MAATEAALHACPRAIEPSLEKLLPLLFLKLVSSKQQMQSAAETMLQGGAPPARSARPCGRQGPGWAAPAVGLGGS